MDNERKIRRLDEESRDETEKFSRYEEEMENRESEARANFRQTSSNHTDYERDRFYDTPEQREKRIRDDWNEMTEKIHQETQHLGHQAQEKATIAGDRLKRKAQQLEHALEESVE